jgi:hypothetical protein
MTARSLASIAHLVKLCGMFGSAHAGERASAALLADRYVRQVLHVTWADVLAQPPGEWAAMARYCGERAHLLTPRERHFITTIGRMRTPPSDRQMAWLTAIYSRLREEAA